MRTEAYFGGIALLVTALALAGCSGSDPPPPSPPAPAKPEAPAASAEPEAPPKEPVESGMACAKAEAQCGGGACALSIDNTCAQPITCNVLMLTVCQAETDLIQLKARRRQTFPAQRKDELSIAASCQTGRTVSSKVQTLECK